LSMIYVGSARIDEKNNIVGGKAGDQKQTTTTDYKGEVAQEKFYVHSSGWNIIRPKDEHTADNLAALMTIACDNKNLGYNQYNRLGVVKHGITTKIPTDCDCSSLVRECVIESTGRDPGNFNTSTETKMLLATGLFTDMGAFISQSKTPVYNGDILVTKVKGHTVIVTSGNPRTKRVDTVFYPMYDTAKFGYTTSIITALSKVGEKDTSLAHRKKIGVANNIVSFEGDYIGAAYQNTKMLELLKSGKLIKA